MAETLDDLFTSPNHYLHSFDADAAIFVPMDRAAYHRSIFLDGRISPAANRPTRVPVATLADGPPPLPTAWIFHVAHCGSTLLARALDRLATNLVLREPLTLRQLALDPDAERLKFVLAMVSKRYRPDLPTIVKANVPVNFLLPRILEFDPDGRAIFLHLGLRDYLLAVLRNEGHREWLRRVTAQLAPHLGDLSSLFDAERAAALWLAQMHAFARALNRMPNGRTLNAETFFAAPGRVLKLAADHLRVPLTSEDVEMTVAGPLFTTYSKNPRLEFNNDMRLERRAELERTLATELEQAQRWIEKGGGEEQALARVSAAALQP
nr:hypothetical protein [Sphingomonas sp.]